ncbi:Mobile element protein [Azospirillum endophyticum]
MSIGQRRELVEADHPRLWILRQRKLVSISRSSYYGPAKGKPAANLDSLRRSSTSLAPLTRTPIVTWMALLLI